MAYGPGLPGGEGHGDWWGRWKGHVRMIRAALIARASDQDIRDLVAVCLADYASHLGTGSGDEVLDKVTGRRHSSLQAAFLWLGSWRPTSAVVLVYSIMGTQISEETQQPAFSPKVSSPKVPLLSETQLSRINSLQVRFRSAEADLSDRLAVIQMLVPDDELVSALDLRTTSVTCPNISQAEGLINTKLTNIRELLIEADQLRHQTLQELFSLLSPQQAARCCLAGYELVFALRSLENASIGQVQVPIIPSYAIPVPVPVIVTISTTARQSLLPESLPLLVPTSPEVSPSIPPLAAVPVRIPLLLPSESPFPRLRTEVSMSEAQLFANAIPVVAEQQSGVSSSSSEPSDK